MNQLPELWLPIVVTAVLIFIASSLIHMVFKWHSSDMRRLANEDEVQAALRRGAAGPGMYGLPHCKGGQDLRSEAVQQKFREGPVGFITLMPNGIRSMGKPLGLWFVFTLLVAALAALLAVQLVGIGGDPHRAGHLVGMVSFMTYAGGSVQSAIWMGKPWKGVAKDVLDSLIYGTISAFVFMWLWH